MLTWWQGTGLGGLSSGTDYIYNDHYQQIATVNAGNGLSADGHEFLITPWNTALILSYTTATANLTSIGGPADQTVINGVVQEIDITTGKVLFQWNSADHVPFSQSEQPLPASPSTPWDWFHINAVHLDTDGNLLIDARDTWTTYKVNRSHGQDPLAARRQGRSFTLQAAPGQTLDSAGEIFAWQHDPEALGNDEYTFFDNESAGTPLLPYSRAVTVKLNPGRTSPRWSPPTTSPRGCRRPRRATRRRPPRATSSSAGARCRTSRSSARPGSCSSTPSSRPGSTPTAPTCCRGIPVDSVDPGSRGARAPAAARGGARRRRASRFPIELARAAAGTPDPEGSPAAGAPPDKFLL